MISVYDTGENLLLYAEPQEYLFQVCTILEASYSFPIKDKYFFNLPMPALVMTAYAWRGGNLSPFQMWAVNGNPITQNGEMNETIQFFHAPMPHIRDDSSVCMHDSASDMMSLFTQFWQSKSKYWLNSTIYKYLNKNFPDDVEEYNRHYMIKDVKFFQDWETKYTVDNITEAPFCNFVATKRFHLPPGRKVEKLNILV